MSKSLYLNINQETQVNFEKTEKFNRTKINDLILLWDYKNFKEKAHIKTSSTKRENFESGYYNFEDIQKKF